MADISKIEINNVSYNIKDAAARQMIENLPTGGTGGGGDWDQNDPLGDGYIKNRTHWKEEIGGEILLPETTVQFSGSGTTLTSATAAADTLAEGDKVSVFWNGTKYVCEAFTYYGYSCLGNASLNTPSAEDTGEPFLFIFQRGGNVTINKQTSTPETITIKVGGKDTIYHKLPPEFLPDGVPYMEKSFLLDETDALETTDPNFGKCWLINKAPMLTTGETYTVIYNGVSYDCVCASGEIANLKGTFVMGNTAAIGGANTGEPFAMMIAPAQQMIVTLDLTGAASVRIGIKGWENVLNVFVDTSTNNRTADKNLDEIWQAVKENKEVHLYFATFVCRLISYYPGQCAAFAYPSVGYTSGKVDSISGLHGIIVTQDGSVHAT